MKIKKFNENNQTEYHILVTRDHMGYNYSDIFETLDDAISWLLTYVNDTILENSPDEEYANEVMEEIIIFKNIDDIIVIYNEFSQEIGLEEKIIYSKGEIHKPKLTTNEFIERWKLGKDTKKYNL